MKNEYRLKRIHFSVCLTKIDAVNFFFKKLGAFSCQNVRCRCQLPVLSFPSSPFDSVCKPGLLFDDVATYPKENHTTIFPFVAKNHITISTIYHVRFLMEWVMESTSCFPHPIFFLIKTLILHPLTL